MGVIQCSRWRYVTYCLDDFPLLSGNIVIGWGSAIPGNWAPHLHSMTQLNTIKYASDTFISSTHRGNHSSNDPQLNNQITCYLLEGKRLAGRSSALPTQGTAHRLTCCHLALYNCISGGPCSHCMEVELKYRLLQYHPLHSYLTIKEIKQLCCT